MMSNSATDYMNFFAVFFKNKNVLIFNSLISASTAIGQTAYNILAFNCPCSPQKNYIYGVAAIGVPALAFFVIGILLNQNSWDLVSECRTRRCRKLSLVAAFALLGSIFGRAVVAPITWTVISLLRGDAYVCAFSEFVDPVSLINFPPTTNTPEVMALFPCKDLPVPLVNYSGKVERQLKYQSQLLGWVLVGVIFIVILLLLCLKTCCSTLGHHQEAYWSQYRSTEKDLFQRTSEAHAKFIAAENVKSFFGFAALDKAERELLADTKDAKSVISREEWNRITGVYMYREINNIPLYSRLNKNAMYTNESIC